MHSPVALLALSPVLQDTVGAKERRAWGSVRLAQRVATATQRAQHTQQGLAQPCDTTAARDGHGVRKKASVSAKPKKAQPAAAAHLGLLVKPGTTRLKKEVRGWQSCGSVW